MLSKQALCYKNNIHNIYNNSMLHTHLTKIYKIIEIYSMMKFFEIQEKQKKNK